MANGFERVAEHVVVIDGKHYREMSDAEEVSFVWGGDVVRESLAAYAHKTWVEWMDYLFSRSVLNANGSVTIPTDLVSRWKRQAGTPYAALPESEKASDRKEAYAMLDIVSVGLLSSVIGSNK